MSWRSVWTVAAVVAVAAIVARFVSPSGYDHDPRAFRTVDRPPRAWLFVSDIHFDPFAGGDGSLTDELAAAAPADWPPIISRPGDPPSPYGQDTNWALLSSAIASMQRTAAGAPVIFVAGDLLGHDFESLYDQFASDTSEQAYQAFVDKTIAFLAIQLGKAFPRSQFVVTIGNNDSYCGDYQNTPGSPFLAHFAQAWSPLVNHAGRAPAFARSFSQAGSYVARLPFRRGRVVVLNDVYWSPKYENACGSPSQSPGPDAVRWLTAAARRMPAGTKPWLVTHIPPGIDVFASQRSGQVTTMLGPSYQQGLMRILGRRQWRVGVVGHVHMSSWRVAAGAHPLPFLVVPSISPLFANNPAYLAVRVSPAGAILDYSAYAFSLGAARPAWSREYGFDAAYGVKGFTARALGSIQGKLRTMPAMRTSWERFYTSGSGNEGINAGNFQAYWCGNAALTAARYATCTSPVTKRVGRRQRSAGRLAHESHAQPGEGAGVAAAGE